MAKLPKCKLCKEEVNKSDESSFIKKSSGYFHVTCQEEKEANKDKVACNFCKVFFENEEEIVKRGSYKLHQKCLDDYQNSEEKPAEAVRIRTCPICKEKVNPLNLDSIDTDTATFHRACYEGLQRQKKNREELHNYISLKYNVNFPTGFMLKQISDFHEKRGYSFKAMLVTLRYMFDVEKVSTKEGVGLGLIPFYFEKAKSHHRKIRTAGDSAQNIVINNEAVKIKAVAPTRRSKAGYIDLNTI